jgi:dATP pyrophosphohydrolase
MIKFVANTIQAHIARYFEDIKDWKILLLKRADNLKIYPGIWQVITGTMEEGEKAIDTAKREINEETGIDVSNIYTVPYVTSFFNAQKDSVNFSPVFGMITKRENVIISEEHSDCGWFTLQECDKMLVLPSHNEANHIFYDYILKGKLINI